MVAFLHKILRICKVQIVSNSRENIEVLFSFTFLDFLATLSVFSKHWYVMCRSSAEMGRLVNILDKIGVRVEQSFLSITNGKILISLFCNLFF